MLYHWEAFGPPVYISVASYLGLTKKRTSAGATTPDDKGKTDEEKYGDLNSLAAMFSGTGGLIS